MNTVKGLGAMLTTLLLMAAVGCASTKTQEGTGQYVDDTVITTKVKAAILEEPGLKSSEINVETFKGVVQLSGFVSSRADINSAVRVASVSTVSSRSVMTCNSSSVRRPAEQNRRIVCTFAHRRFHRERAHSLF